MSVNRLPFFHAPSTGDKLLAAADSFELRISRLPPGFMPEATDAAADGQRRPRVECRFELAGDLPANGREAGKLLASLVRELEAPCDGENGGAQ